jgi:hypothetical protein
MKIHEYKEREDGGTDLEIELEPDEARILIEVGLIKVLRDSAEEYEKTQSSVGDKDYWINRMDEDE